MRKTMKRITAFVLAMAVLMTTVNWSFVSERTDAEMLDASSTYNTENTGLETDTSKNTEIPVYTLPPQESAEPLPCPSPEAGVDAEPAWTASCQTDEVKVTVSAAEGVVPEGTTVKVTPILADKKETQEQYQQVADKLDEKAEGESYDIIGFLAYDITLIDPEGNEMEPNGDVKVTMEYIKATLPEAVASSEENNPNVTVMHFAENATGEVEEVVDLSRMDSELADELKINKIDTLQVDDKQAIEAAAFETDGFSTFTLVWTLDNDTETRNLNVKVVVNREDKTLSRVDNYVITNLKDGDNHTATYLSDFIKNDGALTGCTFVGMQLGEYSPENKYGYVGAISYHRMGSVWHYQKLNPDGSLGGWDALNWEDGDATVTLVYETAPEFTVVWTANGNRKLNVNIVVNGNKTDLHDRQYPDANADGNYKFEVTAENGSCTAPNLAGTIYNDQVLDGCTFVGMQLGAYNPGGDYIWSISYHPTNINNDNPNDDIFWYFQPLNDGKEGGWTTLDKQTWGESDNLTVTLVYQTALEVHVVDRAGNPIPMPETQLPGSIKGGSVQFENYTNNVYTVNINSTANVNGTELNNAIRGTGALNNYAYVGMTLLEYNAGNPQWAKTNHSISFNTIDSKRSWVHDPNEKDWVHWDGLQYGQNPKIYLVYDTPRKLKVQVIEAETGDSLIEEPFYLLVTQTTGTAASTIHQDYVNQDIKNNYTFIGAQPGEYVYGPTQPGPDGTPIAVTWIYNIAYSFTDQYWSYTTSQDNGSPYIKWMEGEEATISLIYDKNNATLHEVETLSTKGTGIYMRLLNYSNPGQEIMVGDPQFPTGHLGGSTYEYQGESGRITQGLVQRVLGEDGYPVTADNPNDNGQAGLSLAPLFAGEYVGYGYKNEETGKTVSSYGEVDNLFRKDIYEETGYYAYSCFENYAYLAGKNFVLYEELGTPSDTDIAHMLYYKRGNFFPFNPIKAGDIAYRSRNWYNGDGSLKKPNDPDNPNNRYGETLYKTQGVDYFFGMYVEAHFYQPKDGLVENPTTGNMENMVYQFNGDDDLWIFVDDVLLLDIGGVHDAHDGKIDFATGKISWTDCATGKDPVTYDTTIKDQFEAAGIFPDGTTWVDSRVDEYFDGDTFKDFTTHTMKMFYMERGAGASNLQMSFNLKVIPDEMIEVSKALDNDPENRYSDVPFAFQIWVQKQDDDGDYINDYELLTEPAYYKGVVDEDDEPVVVPFKERVTLNGNEYENVYFIKPGETAQFSDIPENRMYYIVEVGLNTSQYQKAKFGDQEGEKVDGDDNAFKMTPIKAGEKAVVEIVNTCKTGNFEITKQMKEGQTSDDTFSFRVWVENLKGELVPYKGNYYLYDANDNPIVNTDTENGAFTTEEDGVVTGVKVGYKAEFKAFLNGTRFYVDEIQYSDKYITPTKLSTNDVPDKLPIPELDSEVDVDGAVIEGNDRAVTMTITNEYKPSVSVTKKWNDVQARDRDGIYVGLYEKDNGSPKYVEGTAVILQANNNWTYTWKYVEAGRTYLVRELRLAEAGETADVVTINNQNYVPVDEGQSVVVSDVKYNVGYSEKQDTTDTNNGGAVEAFTVTNTIVWNIMKTGLGDGLGDSNQKNRAPLAGAKFTLISDANVRYEGVSRKGDGVVEWKQGDTSVTVLPAGTYTLEEVQAPSGYVLNTDDWTITVSDQGVPSITTGNTAVVGSIDAQSHELVFDFHNSPMYDLPSSGAGNGSFGIFGYIAGGIIIMLAAVILVFKSSGKRSILEK